MFNDLVDAGIPLFCDRAQSARIGGCRVAANAARQSNLAWRRHLPKRRTRQQGLAIQILHRRCATSVVSRFTAIVVAVGSWIASNRRLSAVVRFFKCFLSVRWPRLGASHHWCEFVVFGNVKDEPTGGLSTRSSCDGCFFYRCRDCGNRRLVASLHGQS